MASEIERARSWAFSAGLADATEAKAPMSICTVSTRPTEKETKPANGSHEVRAHHGLRG